MSATLLTSDLVVALDQEDHILPDGYLVIEDDRILELGSHKDLDHGRKFDEVILWYKKGSLNHACKVAVSSGSIAC